MKLKSQRIIVTGAGGGIGVTYNRRAPCAPPSTPR